MRTSKGSGPPSSAGLRIMTVEAALGMEMDFKVASAFVGAEIA